MKKRIAFLFFISLFLVSVSYADDTTYTSGETRSFWDVFFGLPTESILMDITSDCVWIGQKTDNANCVAASRNLVFSGDVTYRYKWFWTKYPTSSCNTGAVVVNQGENVGGQQVTNSCPSGYYCQYSWNKWQCGETNPICIDDKKLDIYTKDYVVADGRTVYDYCFDNWNLNELSCLAQGELYSIIGYDCRNYGSVCQDGKCVKGTTPPVVTPPTNSKCCFHSGEKFDATNLNKAVTSLNLVTSIANKFYTLFGMKPLDYIESHTNDIKSIEISDTYHLIAGDESCKEDYSDIQVELSKCASKGISEVGASNAVITVTNTSGGSDDETQRQTSFTKEELEEATPKQILSAACDFSSECEERKGFEVKCKTSIDISSKNKLAWEKEKGWWCTASSSDFSLWGVVKGVAWLVGTGIICEESQPPEGTCVASAGGDTSSICSVFSPIGEKISITDSPCTDGIIIIFGGLLVLIILMNLLNASKR